MWAEREGGRKHCCKALQQPARWVEGKGEEGNTREALEEERRERKTKKGGKGKQAEKHRNKARKTEKNKQSPIQLTESNK